MWIFWNTPYTYLHARSWRLDIYEWRKPYFSGTTHGAHLNAATTSLCPRASVFLYRKTLWNTPFAFSTLTPWIILGFRSRKRAQRAGSSSSSHLSSTIWWHDGDCRFFSVDLWRYETATYLHVCSLSFIARIFILYSMRERNYSLQSKFFDRDTLAD